MRCRLAWQLGQQAVLGQAAQAKREQGENDQRHRHDAWALVRCVCSAMCAKEHVEALAGHVERRQQGGGGGDPKNWFRPSVRPSAGQDFVLAEKTAGERERHQCERAAKVGDRRHRHWLGQAAHFADVLFLVAAVDDRAGAEEQQRLEKCVCQKMKHPHGHTSHAKADHHQAKLTDRRVGQDALEVVLAKRDERGNERGGRPHPRHHRERAARLKQRDRPRHEEHAGRHHRRRVDECTDRRRPLHRVRQPHVQRQLAGLADRTREQKQARPFGQSHPHDGFNQQCRIIASTEDTFRAIKRQRAG